MITKIKTENREDWLAERKKSIGGSDAGTICGYNKYSTRFALWAEKTGAMEPEDISGKESVRLGNDLEAYAANRFSEATGKKVRRCNFTFRNDQYPFAHANIDREVVGESAGLECKTTSNRDYIALCLKGEYPAVWYCQMLHYLMVTGWKKWYLEVVCFGVGCFTFEIERTPEIEREIEALAGIEKGFWEEVQTNTPPDIDGEDATGEAIASLVGKSEAGKSIDLTGAIDHLYRYRAIEGQIQQLSKQLEEEKNHVRIFMGDAEKGSCGGFSVNFKSQERSTFDSKRFAAEHPEIDLSGYYNKTSLRPLKISIKEK